MSTTAPQSEKPETSFAETALKLGGKSDDEARRTGAIDRADDQVEQLFRPEYQTTHSPAHRAVWDRGLPVEMFIPSRGSHAGRREASDGRLDRRGAAASARRARCWGATTRSPIRCSANWRRRATGDCWSIANTAESALPCGASPRFSPRWRRSIPPSPGWLRFTAASARSIPCARSAARSRNVAGCRSWPAASGFRRSRSPSRARGRTSRP